MRCNENKTVQKWQECWKSHVFISTILIVASILTEHVDLINIVLHKSFLSQMHGDGCRLDDVDSSEILRAIELKFACVKMVFC